MIIWPGCQPHLGCCPVFSSETPGAPLPPSQASNSSQQRHYDGVRCQIRCIVPEAGRVVPPTTIMRFRGRREFKLSAVNGNSGRGEAVKRHCSIVIDCEDRIELGDLHQIIDPFV